MVSRKQGGEWPWKWRWLNRVWVSREHASGEIEGREGRRIRWKFDFCSANLNWHEQQKTAFIETKETDTTITEIQNDVSLGKTFNWVVGWDPNWIFLCRKKYSGAALGPKMWVKDGTLFMVLNEMKRWDYQKLFMKNTVKRHQWWMYIQCLYSSSRSGA